MLALEDEEDKTASFKVSGVGELWRSRSSEAAEEDESELTSETFLLLFRVRFLVGCGGPMRDEFEYRKVF